MVGGVDGVRGVQNGFYSIWPRQPAPRRALPERGLKLAKINILAVTLPFFATAARTDLLISLKSLTN